MDSIPVFSTISRYGAGIYELGNARDEDRFGDRVVVLITDKGNILKPFGIISMEDLLHAYVLGRLEGEAFAEENQKAEDNKLLHCLR